jgi:hypothetical protein
LAQFQSRENQNKDYASKTLRMAKDAVKRAQREQSALVEEESRCKEQTTAMDKAGREAMQREAALREAENRREDIIAKVKETMDEVREARNKEQALREAKRREKEAKIERERAEREAR